MNALATVCIGATVAGLVLATVLHFNLSPLHRLKVERLCLQIGGVGTLLLMAPWVMNSDKPSLVSAMVALGLIVSIPLVVGIALRATRQGAPDV